MAKNKVAKYQVLISWISMVPPMRQSHCRLKPTWALVGGRSSLQSSGLRKMCPAGVPTIQATSSTESIGTA
jgi:hypothetical protein